MSDAIPPVRASAGPAIERGAIGPAQGPATARHGSAPAIEQADLRQAAEQFEAVFLRQLIGAMRQARLADDVFGSQAADSYRELADANLADAMARRGSIGIAALVEHQLGAAK
jgi:peptidoglycan hydrolase FlgJ